MSVEQLYCRDSSGATVACVLDDITILYHRPSGQTHMAVSPVPEILAALDQGDACSAAGVHTRLSANYDMGDPGEATARIEAHLVELTGLGLVRAA